MHNILNLASKIKIGLSTVLLASSISMSGIIQASEGGHNKQHFVGVFAGVHDSDETETALGVEYEYKFDSSWGVGASYEDVKEAHHGDGISTKIASVFFHPDANWRLGVGLGKEEVGGAHSFSENLVRVGASYDFHVGEFGIAPSINFDRVDGEVAKVYGVALVFSF